MLTCDAMRHRVQYRCRVNSERPYAAVCAMTAMHIRPYGRRYSSTAFASPHDFGRLARPLWRSRFWCQFWPDNGKCLSCRPQIERLMTTASKTPFAADAIDHRSHSSLFEPRRFWSRRKSNSRCLQIARRSVRRGSNGGCQSEPALPHLHLWTRVSQGRSLPFRRRAAP